MLGSSGRPPRQRLIRLHVVLREGAARRGTYSTAEVSRGATIEVYPHTTFGVVRRMIDAHVPQDWADKLRRGNVEFFLAALQAQQFQLDDTEITPEDTLMGKGLGALEQIHLVVFVDDTVEPEHRRRWSIAPNSSPASEASSPTTGIGRSGRISLSLGNGPNSSPAPQESTVVFVRVVGSVIPKALRVVLECSPHSFVESVFSALEAKLLQLGAPVQRPLLPTTHAFFLFVLLGVGTGKAGRRVEPLERIQHILDEGSNVLTLCLREYVAKPIAPEPEATVARTTSVAEMRKVFVSSSAWDNQTDESTPPPVVLPPMFGYEVAAPLPGDDGAANDVDAEPEPLVRAPSTVLRVQLDLPPVSFDDNDDDCDPTNSRVHQFSTHEVHQSSSTPMPLEDAFDILSSSDDDDVNDVRELQIDASHTAADWQVLPFSFVMLVGFCSPALFVDDALSGDAAVDTTTDAGLVASRQLLPDIEAIERDLREEEMILAFDLFEDLTSKEVTVLDPCATDVVTAELLRTILHTMGDFSDDSVWRRSSVDGMSSNSGDMSPGDDGGDFLTRDWDIDDVETVVALPTRSTAQRKEPAHTARPETPPLDFHTLLDSSARRIPSGDTAAMPMPVHPTVGNTHPLSQWSGFCGPQPLTPVEIAKPLAMTHQLTERHTQSVRQNEFFRQQALAPLLPEHRRLHIAKDLERQAAQHQQHHPHRGALAHTATRQSTQLQRLAVTDHAREPSPHRRDNQRLPQISTSSPQFASRRQPPPSSTPQRHEVLERMNVVASIYRPPVRTPLSTSLHPHHTPVSRSLPERLPSVHEHRSHMLPHAAAHALSQSQNLRGSFGNTNQSSVGMREQGTNDVFSFLSQTLRNIHDDAMTLPTDANSGGGPDGSHGQLDLLRSAAVATYTQRLLLEHRDLAQRAAELARMFQSSPPTSQLGASQRLYQQLPFGGGSRLSGGQF